MSDMFAATDWLLGFVELEIQDEFETVGLTVEFEILLFELEDEFNIGAPFDAFYV